MKDLSEAGLRLMTTWPCVAEAAFLLQPPQRYEMLRWIELGGAVVCPFAAHDLRAMGRWMRRYTGPGKREMDFADASLCWLAMQTGVTEIMTTDAADFSRYRLPDGRAFSPL